MSQAAQHGRLTVTPDRRDMSPHGVARRARFEGSLDRLRELELSDDALEHYRRLARKTRKLPHLLVREIAESAARADFIQSTIWGGVGRPR